MATDDSVTFQNPQQLEEFLSNITGANIDKALRPAKYEIADTIRGKMSVYRYPGRPRYPLKWASEKQRRWYFASRRSSGAGLPYHRLTDPWSQQLGQSWRISPSGQDYVTGTPVDYGPQVQSSEMQTEMHKETGWVTDEQAVLEAEREGVIGQEIERALDDFFKQLGGR